MSKRRPYRLGKRQGSVDETRRRVLNAAVAEYAENGIEETTMVAVARRADVASGTVLYHYPDPEALADAIVEMWIEGADFNEVLDVAEGTSLEQRVDLLIKTVFNMYDEHHPAGPIYLKSPQHPAMRKLQSFWDEKVGQVISDTLGGHLVERDKLLISAIIGGQFLSSLLRHGIGEDQIHDTISRLIIAWLTFSNQKPEPTRT